MCSCTRCKYTLNIVKFHFIYVFLHLVATLMSSMDACLRKIHLHFSALGLEKVVDLAFEAACRIFLMFPEPCVLCLTSTEFFHVHAP
jgi:hypothetical protein